MSEEKLVYAPLIRVSTERQEKQGESLNTQRKQLETAILHLGGRIFDWYGGQEHATPDQERQEMERLMRDALDHKIEAIMVTDISRWSRDNRKSKDYVRQLKDNGIKFFVGTKELSLYDPTQAFMLGISVEVAEFFASEQAYKSIINRIERAKAGRPSSSGRVPFGRLFNKKTGEWTVDEEKRKVVEEAAHLYLYENVTFKQLGKRFGINHAYLWQVLTQRCGDTWEQRFREKRFGIDETVQTPVPRLLPDETIQQIKAKCDARKVWDKGSPGFHHYLLGHIIFDEESGYALTGLTNHLGQQHYRPFSHNIKRYMINAQALEKAILDALFRALSDTSALTSAVFEGNPRGTVAEGLGKRKAECDKSLRSCDKKISNMLTAIERYGGQNVDSFLEKLEERMRVLEQERSSLLFELKTIDDQLAELPTQVEIANKREWMRRQIAMRTSESYFRSPAAFYDLPYEDQRKLVILLFGGKDASGKRYGIYVKPLGGSPRRYSFSAYGRLGNVDGWIESRTGRYSSNAAEVFDSSNGNLHGEVGKVVRQANSDVFERYDKDELSGREYKARMVSEGGADQSRL